MSNITKVYLLNAPLEPDYKHTLYFADKTEQYNYFYNLVAKKYKNEDFSYQRKDGFIRVPLHFDDAIKCNYVMYQNTAYSDKWFYAFIVDIKYVNDERTDVYIKTDVIQTWLFDYEIKSCFVAREHTKDDTIGKNTIPEGLETGEYICNNTIHNRSTENTTYIVASKVNLQTGKDSGLTVYGGVVNGWYYYYFDDITALEETLGDLAELRTNDAIVSIFVMPRDYVRRDSGMVIQDYSPTYTMWEEIKAPTHINGYVPQNNKLFTYPYSYLLVDNNAGASAVYKYELFNKGENGTLDFKIYCTITPGGSMRLLPLRYNGVVGENNNFGLPAGKFPICGWQSDYYTNWLTQNSLNLEVQAEAIRLTATQNIVNSTVGGMSSALGFKFADALGQIPNQLFAVEQYQNQIRGMLGQQQMHEFQSPTTSGNTNTGDVNFASGLLRFSAYQMSVKEEYAKIIDNYFSMYGYQTNRVKIPNKNHRKRYWFTKTVGCEIDGALPNEDLQLIKNCYDNGITFWRNDTEIGKYTDMYDRLYSNDII